MGLMQRRTLLISDILSFAVRFHRAARIVTRRSDGSTVIHDYAGIARRAAQLGHALLAQGVVPGDRVATLAWNDHRHLEAYFAITGIGAVCHTINPRLFDDQIAQIIEDAGDTVLLVDPEFLSVLERLLPQMAATSLRTVVVLDDRLPEMPRLAEAFTLMDYESFLAERPATIEWPRVDEEAAALLCYTSGTTGLPKGVLYSHRATVLHAYAICLPDVFGLRAIDRVMPVVPMYHVNAWGLPFAATLVGAGQVLPGPRPTPADLLALIHGSGVTFTAGVPTVWLGLLQELRHSSESAPHDLRIISGGAACPVALVQALSDEFGIAVTHAWGMTEMSPVGLCNMPKPETQDWPRAQCVDHQRKQGRPLFGVDIRIVDSDGCDIAADGTAFGELLVRGPWIARGYFGHEEGGALDADGWFHTGDIVTIDDAGYIEIVDRAKDVIKSGGEWISSIALENIAIAHPNIIAAAVIAARHDRWDERPLLIVVASDPACPPACKEVLGWYEGKVSKWWIPDDIVFVDSLPYTGTGKVLKTELKARFGDYLRGQQSRKEAER